MKFFKDKEQLINEIKNMEDEWVALYCAMHGWDYYEKRSYLVLNDKKLHEMTRTDLARFKRENIRQIKYMRIRLGR